MNSYTLNRINSLPDGTFGFITDEDGVTLVQTCELPWLDNEKDKSCIPTGTYTCIAHNSPHHPDVWEVTNVSGRTGVLIHNGNTEADSLGCIIVGLTFGMLNGADAVLQSNAAIEKLRGIWRPPFQLIITENLT